MAVSHRESVMPDEDINLDDFTNTIPGEIPDGAEEAGDDTETDVGDDEGLADDEGENADGEEGNESPDPEGDAEPAPASRQTRRTQTLREREREAEERASRAEAELARVRRETDAREQAAAQQREQELLANMGPEEKAQYFTNKRLENTERQLAQANFRHEDAMDKMEFQKYAAKHELAVHYEEKVEKAIAELRRDKNMNANRLAMYHYLLGKDTDAKAAKSASSQRRVGKTKVAAARTNSVSPRGNTSVSSGGGKSLEKRLENQLL